MDRLKSSLTSDEVMAYWWALALSDWVLSKLNITKLTPMVIKPFQVERRYYQIELEALAIAVVFRF